MGGRPREIDRALVPASTPKRYAVVQLPKREVWRSALRQAVGSDGQRLWKVLLAIAEGEAWIPRLPDGREGPPVTPTTRDRLQAAMYLGDALFGRAVDQTQVVAAEHAAQDNAALTALSDDELLLEAERILEGVPAAARRAIVDGGSE
jgi:hypothetical protein